MIGPVLKWIVVAIPDLFIEFSFFYFVQRKVSILVQSLVGLTPKSLVLGNYITTSGCVVLQPGYRFRVPARMDDSDVLTLQRQRQLREKFVELVFLFRAGGAFSRSLPAVIAKEPLIIQFLIAAQNIQLVISHDALGMPAVDHAHDLLDNSRAVRTPVHQVSHENQSPSVGMRPVGSILQFAKQVLHGAILSMNIANDIQRALK